MDRKEEKKAYYLKNKERRKAYREANKDKIKEQRKEYYKDNKDKAKEYIEANIERIKKYNKSPNRKKTYTISNWKRSGLVCEDYDSLYQKYIESTNCEECGCEYGKYKDGSSSWKCMDHSHITGLFRNFLCNNCNLTRVE